MGRKYKTTGCAKFFFVIIILAPLAYLGASYYNGQDGWANLKGLFGGSSTERIEKVEDQSKLTEEIKDLKQKVKKLEVENEKLQGDLQACQEAAK